MHKQNRLVRLIFVAIAAVMGLGLLSVAPVQAASSTANVFGPSASSAVNLSKADKAKLDSATKASAVTLDSYPRVGYNSTGSNQPILVASKGYASYDTLQPGEESEISVYHVYQQANCSLELGGAYPNHKATSKGAWHYLPVPFYMLWMRQKCSGTRSWSLPPKVQEQTMFEEAMKARKDQFELTA